MEDPKGEENGFNGKFLRMHIDISYALDVLRIFTQRYSIYTMLWFNIIVLLQIIYLQQDTTHV